MIRQYPENTVIHLFLTHLFPVLRHPRSIFLSRHLFDLGKNRGKQIAVIVRWIFLKTLESICGGENSRHPLQPHPRIHVPLGQRLELASRLGIELNKNQIPDFQTARVSLIH